MTKRHYCPKNIWGVVTLMLLLIPLSSWAQDINTTRISLSFKGKKIKEALSIISGKSGIKFFYNEELLGAGRTVSLEAQDEVVSDVLKKVLTHTNLKFEQTGEGRVLIFPDNKNGTPEIHGRVTDAITGSAIPSAYIRLDAIEAVAAADADGNFVLSVPAGDTPTGLSVRSIGYREKHIALDGLDLHHVVITLDEDLTTLDEVVVTGQGGSMSKRRISTNIVTVSAKELEDVPATRVDQLLQSKLPNAQIRLTGGQSGTTSIVRARGVNSAYLNSTPVIYVDGVRLDNLNTKATLGLNLSGRPEYGSVTSSLADIPMTNIERVEFINGGAATTLYGSDAANGVIHIITKKGSQGATRFSFESTLGLETPTNNFLHFKRTAELLFEKSFYQQYNLGMTGGDDRFQYSFSGSYLRDPGVLIFEQNKNKQFNFRTGFRAKLTSALTYESSFSYNNNTYRRVRNGNSGQLTGVGGSGGYEGLYFTEDGASATTGPGFNNHIDELTDEEFSVMKAYVRNAERLQNNPITVNRFQTSQVLKYDVTPTLLVRGTAGVDFRVQHEKSVVTNEFLSFTSNSRITNLGSIDNFDRKYLGLTLELNMQHTWTVGEFSLISTVGGQLFRNDDQQVQYRGDNIRDGAQTINYAATRTSNEFHSTVANYGIYAQENVGYKNKLFLDLGLRGDGNSAFGDDIGIQYYPKVGLAYMLSAEDFMTPLESTVSSVKVRSSYGLSGNFPAPYVNQRTIQLVGFLGEQAASFGQPGASDLGPEKTATLEGGLDLGFVKDRITLSAGYYHAQTSDALFIVPSSPSSGESARLKNVGEILNKGFEFALTAIPVHTKDADVRINASVNTLTNKVVSAGGAAPFNINGFTARTIQTMVQEGYPIGFLRGNSGVFGEDNTFQSAIPQSYLGTTLPDLFGSLGLSARYKRISLSANADYQQGAYALSFDRLFRFSNKIDNEGIPQAEIDKNDRKNYLNFMDRFVESTDYIKVRNISVRYEVPVARLAGKLKSLSVGLAVSNPFTFTKASFDPETTISGSSQGQGSATTGGISYATYSAPRQYLTTIRITF